MSKFSSPLNNLKVASPCSADWNEMVGDERKRFCGQCSLNVYNLSGMTRDEAERLLINSEGRLCVRFYKREDGTVLTKDCPVGWAKVKQKISGTATAAFSLFAGLFGGLFAFSAFKTNHTTTMGAVVMPASNNANVNNLSKAQPPALMGNVAVMGDIATEEPTERVRFTNRRSGK